MGFGVWGLKPLEPKEGTFTDYCPFNGHMGRHVSLERVSGFAGVDLTDL